MNRALLKQEAKQKLAGNWGWAVLVELILGAITFIVGLVTGGLANIIEIWFTASASLAFLHLVDNRKEENVFTAAFTGFLDNRATPIFITALLQSLFTFLWALLFVIPGIIKTYSYAMSTYIVDDLVRQGKQVQPTEAITKSRLLMDGHKMDLFILDLSFIGWGILCLFTLGIGFLWLSPYVRTTRANFYRQLIAQNPQVLDI